MIRQAISCDVCGAEKRETNHWFVATEHGGELRICGWNSRKRLRPDTRHLCGQTCLHKLMDEFMARTIAGKANATEQEPALAQVRPTRAQTAPINASLMDASLTNGESSARSFLSPRAIETSRPDRIESSRVNAEPVRSASALNAIPAPAAMERIAAVPPFPHLLTMPARVAEAAPAASLIPLAPPLAYSPRRLHAEAWERERARAQHNGDSSQPRKRF